MLCTRYAAYASPAPTEPPSMAPHCRRTSKTTTGAAAATLSEFFRPNVGISTQPCDACITVSKYTVSTPLCPARYFTRHRGWCCLLAVACDAFLLTNVLTYLVTYLHHARVDAGLLVAEHQRNARGREGVGRV